MLKLMFAFFLSLTSILTHTLGSEETELKSLNYVVDCSACYSSPLKNLDSYSCEVRCEINEKSETNVTGIYEVLNQVLQELKETKLKLENTSQRLNNALQEMEETSRDLNETRREMQSRFSTIEQKVAFTVRLNTNLQTDVGDVIKFNVILYNAGSGYNATTGIFTTPSNGTYEFTLITANRYGSTVVRTDLMRGDEMLFRVRSDGDQNSFAVGTIIVDLTDGEEIYAKTLEASNYNSWFNVFSGHKL